MHGGLTDTDTDLASTVVLCACGRQCPIMDIMLKGSERSIGMCTDAMLYVLHLGARVIGGLDDARQYDSYCGAATARLFLENMHEEFLSKQPGVLHMQLVNAEHLYLKDAKLHKKMDAFLVKALWLACCDARTYPS